MTIDAKLQALLDKQSIHDNLMLYCRACDRFDIDLMRTTRWPDSTENHGEFDGSGQEWCDYSGSWKHAVCNANHHVSNVLIELDGIRAKCESMFIVVVQYTAGNTMFLGGRYRDLCEKRGDDWKILRRDVIWDWLDDKVLSNRWDLHNAPEMSNWGGFCPDDPIYRDWTRGEFTAMPRHLKSKGPQG
jgi:SnoaL-like domain